MTGWLLGTAVCNSKREYATNSSEKAIANAAKKEVIDGMAEFRTFLDKLIQTSGNGVLATVSASDGAGGLTFAKTTNPFGAQLLRFNQKVSVYTSDLATKRGTGTITAIFQGDTDALPPTATLATGGTDGDVTLANIIATDLILPDGVSGATPTSLFGLKYFQSNSATGTYLNMLRSSFPEIRTPTFNAGGASLTQAMIRLALNKIKKALGINGVGTLMAYCNLEQEHAYENLAINYTQIQKTEGSQGIELLFNGKKTMGGVPLTTSINADPTRIDFLDISHWGRAVMQDIDYFEIGNNTVFPVYSSSDGGLVAAYLFYFITGFQVWNDSPRNGSYLQNLARTDGY